MPAALEVRALTKRYRDNLAVDGVDLTVDPGQVVGLLGPNGSGKTTTLSCALGLLRPTSGQVEVLGEPARRLHRTRGRVGVVFDRPHVLPHLSVKANLTYARKLRGHKGGRADAEALERAGIAHLAMRQAGRLSLGQTKRVAIAMALAGSPELLVLDEPLSGLDPVGVREILRLVGELAGEGLTILLSSHRLLDVEPVLTHAAVLLRGKLAAHGTLDELCGAGSRYVIEVDDAERARTLLSGSVERTPDGHLLVDAGEAGPAALNRRLLEGGVAVAGLRSARVSLAQVFERLVDQAEEAQR